VAPGAQARSHRAIAGSAGRALAGEIEQQAALSLLEQQDLEQRLRDMASEIPQLNAAVATQGERRRGSRADAGAPRGAGTPGLLFGSLKLVQQREQVLEQQARLQALERSRTVLQRDRGSLAAAQAAQRRKRPRARAAIEREISALDQRIRNTNRAARS
jgi:membrane fusion protein